MSQHCSMVVFIFLNINDSSLGLFKTTQYQFIDPGWWFGTCFIFPYIGNFIIPIDFHIFQRASNHQPEFIDRCFESTNINLIKHFDNHSFLDCCSFKTPFPRPLYAENSRIFFFLSTAQELHFGWQSAKSS